MAIKKRYIDNPMLKIMQTKDRLHSEKGMDFIIRELCSKELVPDAKYRQNHTKTTVSQENDPFMPPFFDQEVILRNFTPKLRLMYNKFPIVSYHLLIVTKEFEQQTKKLDKHDFEGALIAMEALGDGVTYMNCGHDAGASQPHKHLQCIPESEMRLTNGRLPLSLAIEN